jgi:hypothetical protein
MVSPESLNKTNDSSNEKRADGVKPKNTLAVRKYWRWKLHDV